MLKNKFRTDNFVPGNFPKFPWFDKKLFLLVPYSRLFKLDLGLLITVSNLVILDLLSNLLTSLLMFHFTRKVKASYFGCL